jgi:eukaryotic-like serine/threonine-protein kinase
MSGRDPDEQALHDGSAETLVGSLAPSPSSTPSMVAPDEGELDELQGDTRYEARALLGRGGMGEVQLCKDLRIGRDIAMKVIRDGRGSRSDAQLRFLREARVQAQLEHPSIVPVYDLGRTEEGQVYFTMKRVRGQSLDGIVARLRRGEASETLSRRRLLAAFGQVCMAVDYAHERGVLHRDLKPANIMLGDYGEVYVLDWGLAKIAGAPELELLDRTHLEGGDLQETAAGEVLGTPGYIAPEQIGGEVDRRSDVYALGVILFEVLALQRLHEGKSAQALLMSTLDGTEARPSRRAPELDVPPELEEICLRATALSPDDRFATARALHDAIERFLDGDRDVELRREYARTHAEAAAAATERALAGDDAARGEAMREVGHTLGLEPGNTVAMRALAQLLENPPRELPPEAAAAIERANDAQVRTGARNGAIGYLSWFLYMPLIFWMGVRDGLWLAISSGLLLAAAGADLWVSRSKNGPGTHFLAPFVGAVALASLYGLFGAYVFLPTVMVGMVVSISQSPYKKHRMIAVTLGCLAVAVPAMLEWQGLIPTATVFVDGAITVVPHMTEFPPLATRVVLLAASLGLIITPMLFIGQVRDTLTAAELRIQVQAWHLRQLVSTHPSASSPAARDRHA